MAEFLIAALRAVIELVVWCLLGQGVLGLLAGNRRQDNVIYRLFELITRPPRQVVAKLLKRAADHRATGIVSFVILFAAWVGLAILRKFI